jgi:mono/diheme cytochrome c family protein
MARPILPPAAGLAASASLVIIDQERSRRDLMRWTRWTAATAAVGAGALCALAISCATQKMEEPKPAAVDPVARGKYLAITSGCIDCHTPGTLYGAPDTTRMLSGSELGWQGPWGVTYPRNLTPDMETGLGKYTADQIVTAIRTGKRLDGSPMLPPMPWPEYSQMTDADLQAIAAYLKSIPAVSHKAPDRVPPGKKAPAVLTFPPPPAWDGQNLPAPPGAPAKEGGH